MNDDAVDFDSEDDDSPTPVADLSGYAPEDLEDPSDCGEAL